MRRFFSRVSSLHIAAPASRPLFRALSFGAAAPAAANNASAAPRTPLPAGYLDSGDDEAKPRPAVQLGVFGVAYSPVSRLRAVARATTGKRPAQWARTNGLLPSQVYGGAGPPQHIYIAEKDLRALVRARGQSFLSSLVDLELGEGGVVVRVLARDFQMHPFRNKFICCNWVRYTPGRYPGTKVDLPLVAVNEERCPAYRDGAWLLDLQHKVPVWCNGDRIPDHLTMDLRGKKVGEKIMASELELGEGVTLVRRRDCRARRVGPPLPPSLSPTPFFTHTIPFPPPPPRAALHRARLCGGKVHWL
jgi:large subunit ribosomal protein L25